MQTAFTGPYRSHRADITKLRGRLMDLRREIALLGHEVDRLNEAMGRFAMMIIESGEEAGKMHERIEALGTELNDVEDAGRGVDMIEIEPGT